MALDLFATKTFNPRVIASKAVAYTVLATDELVIMTGATARTFTLPSLDSFINTMQMGEKVYKFTNNGTANLTIQPGTSAIGVADTIGGKATWTVYPNESIFITGFSNLVDWKMSSPTISGSFVRNSFVISQMSNGTTAVHMFDSSGAPVALNITEVLVNAQDAIASNITLTGGASTVVVIAKSTVAGTIVGATTLSAYAAVAAGSTVSFVGSDTSASARVTIIGTSQNMI